MDLFNIPASPDIQRVGQRRNIGRTLPRDTKPSIITISSDESVLESVEPEASTSRIVRDGHPSGSHDRQSSDAFLPDFDCKEYLQLRFTFLELEEAKVRAAWTQAGGDLKVAKGLLQDPCFKPNASSDALSAPIVGRIKEIDEATKAERAAVREKGKKSMIYAGRSNLDTQVAIRKSTPPRPRVSSTDAPTSPNTPNTPDVGPRRKRLKRVVASDEESEAQDLISEADTMRNSYRLSDESSDERRALNYFNTASSEGLQELTGGCGASRTIVPSNSFSRLQPCPS